jgi:hypothetical protein
MEKLSEVLFIPFGFRKAKTKNLVVPVQRYI